MRILKPGKRFETVFTGTCRTCECEFEMDMHDKKHGRVYTRSCEYNSWDYFAKCPCCHNEVLMLESKNEIPVGDLDDFEFPPHCHKPNGDESSGNDTTPDDDTEPETPSDENEPESPSENEPSENEPEEPAEGTEEETDTP